MEPMGLFALPDHLSRLSKTGDPLEVLDQVVDFEQFREPLERALGYADGSKGGRPPYDPVVMFKILILAARHTVSDERMEFLIRDRLSWLRFLGFDLGAPTPDRNTIWTFRERLTKAGAIDDLFVAFEGALRAAGYLPMGGQIVDATLVSAPRQRLTRAEKEAAQAGEPADAIWPGQPAKAAQKDLDARWTVKTGRQRPPDGAGRQLPAIAIPVFGYKNHVAIDRAWGFIRRSAVTDAACYDGSMLRGTGHQRQPGGQRLGGHGLPLGRPTRRGWWTTGGCRGSTARSRPAGRCRGTLPAATPASLRCALTSSMSSPTRRNGWASSSAPSDSTELAPGSAWRTSPTTSSAWSSTNARAAVA